VHERNLIRLGARASGPHIDLTVNERNLAHLGARASGPHKRE